LEKEKRDANSNIEMSDEKESRFALEGRILRPRNRKSKVALAKRRGNKKVRFDVIPKLKKKKAKVLQACIG